jgi:hypothetical protein
LTQLAESVAQTAHAASSHAGMNHSIGPYTVAAAAFPFVAAAFLYIKAAMLRRRCRREALVSTKAAAARRGT